MCINKAENWLLFHAASPPSLQPINVREVLCQEQGQPLLWMMGYSYHVVCGVRSRKAHGDVELSKMWEESNAMLNRVQGRQAPKYRCTA